jgi:hypothetical protein
MRKSMLVSLSLIVSACGGLDNGATIGESQSALAIGTLPLTLSAPALTNAANPTYTFSCNGALCLFSCSIDDGPANSCFSPSSFPAPQERTYKVTVMAREFFGGRTASATAYVTVDHTPPKLLSARFDSYDSIALEVSEPLAPASLVPSSFTLTNRPADMAVISVKAGDGSVSDPSSTHIHLALNRLHLPWNGYALTINAQDPAGNLLNTNYGFSSGSGAADARLAYATSTKFDGALTSHTTPDPCAGLSGATRADCLCAQDAAQAGLFGTYRAVLSDSTSDAACRVRGLDGKLATNCGLPTGTPLPPPPSWIRPDGLAVSNPVAGSDLSGLFFATPAMLLDGTRAAVWLGSTRDFTSAAACKDWTDNQTEVGAHSTVGTGPWGSLPLWWHDITEVCSRPQSLLCAETDGNGPQTKPVASLAPARHLFISSATYSANLGQLAGADQHCRDLATAAALPEPNRYGALLSDSNSDAYCRAFGLTGKRASNCGQASLPGDAVPVYSIFGHKLANSVGALLSGPVNGGPLEPFAGTEDQSTHMRIISFTNSDTWGAGAGASCLDWTTSDNKNYTFLGAPYIDGAQWINVGWNYCYIQASLICIQH